MRPHGVRITLALWQEPFCLLDRLTGMTSAARATHPRRCGRLLIGNREAVEGARLAVI